MGYVPTLLLCFLVYWIVAYLSGSMWVGLIGAGIAFYELAIDGREEAQ